MPKRTAGQPYIGFPLVALLLRLAGALLLVLLLTLGFVLGTQTGLRVAVAVAQELAPERVSIGRVEGRLLGKLTLGEVTLDLPGLALDLGHLHLDWRPARLLRGQLHIVDLSVADLDIVTAPPPADKPPSEPFELPQIRLPIGIDVERVLVERLSLRQQDAPAASAIRLTRAEVSATADGDHVALRRLTADLAQPQVGADAAGSVRLSGDYPLHLHVDWHFRQPPALALTGRGTVAGDLAELRVEHQVEGAAVATLSATVRDVLQAPSWRGELTLTELDLPALAPGAPAVDLTAQLKTEGDLERATVTGTLAGEVSGVDPDAAPDSAPVLADLGKLSADLDITWAEQRLTLNQVRLDETQSGAMLDLTGHADLAGSVPSFELSGAWERLRWPLAGDALVEAPLGRLDVAGDLESFDYRLSAEVFGADIPETKLTLAGQGSDQDTRIESLLVDTLNGRIEAKGTAAWAPAVTWDLAITADGIDPGLQVPGLDGQIALKADAQGGLDDGYRFGANLTAALTDYPDAVVNVAGTGDLHGLQLQILSVETLGGVVDGSGKLAWAPDLHWDLTLRADDLNPGLQYPGLDGRVGLTLASAGGLEGGFDYRLQGSTALAAYPTAVLELRGTGTSEAADIETLEIQVLDGRISGGGRVSWTPTVAWNVALTLAELDPGSVVADWPGRIGGAIESSGRLTEQGPDLMARVSDVEGTLRGYPVRLAVEVGLVGQNVELRNLSAGSGSTRLTATGGVTGEQLDVRFDLASPDLGALVPGASGSLDLAGTLAGTVQAPRVRVDLQARDAEFNGQGIAALSASADVGLGPDEAFDIEISGENLIAGAQRFETLSVQGSGRMDQHRLSAAVRGDLIAVELAASGGLAADGAYAGRLTTLSLASGELGTWGLQRPADLAYGQGAVAVGPLCLGNGEGSGGCVAFEQPQRGRFDVSLDVERFNLGVLNPLLPELLVMDGHASARARFRGDGNRLTGDARLEVPTGAVNLSVDDVQGREALVFSGTRLDVTAGDRGLDARLNLPVTDLGGVRATVSLPGFRLDTGAAQPLRGDVQVSLDGLSRVSNLVPDVTNVTGNIAGDVQLAGTLGAPDLRGEVRARGVGLQVPLYGFTLANADITAMSRGAEAVELTGGADIGGGRVTLDGELGWGGGDPAGQVRISGNRLRVADSREYFALVSLDMTIGVGAGGVAVRGEVTVPEARIQPRTVPAGTVQPSPDVVVIGQDADEEALPLSLDVLARLGEEVVIDAFGLRGALRGELRVLKAPQGDILGDGQLQIVDGTFRVTLPTLGVLTAIGRPLTIEQGFVVFARTPVDNPGLVLNAQREGGDMTAGVQVLGTLRNPKLAFFSESDPNMTQAEVTQYLVTGIPPKRDAQADSRAIAVGTYVAPRLYMEFEGAASDTEETVKFRYDLSRNIELQTETGGSQGADIFFKFEN